MQQPIRELLLTLRTNIATAKSVTVATSELVTVTGPTTPLALHWWGGPLSSRRPQMIYSRCIWFCEKCKKACSKSTQLRCRRALHQDVLTDKWKLKYWCIFHFSHLQRDPIQRQQTIAGTPSEPKALWLLWAPLKGAGHFPLIINITWQGWF